MADDRRALMQSSDSRESSSGQEYIIAISHNSRCPAKRKSKNTCLDLLGPVHRGYGEEIDKDYGRKEDIRSEGIEDHKEELTPLVFG
ncbi:hypothetical protein L596_015721 [Steinernema carpocapsae]|uniref:Uncharacterized protein n=1 Tax=Steinernema carpocapsae TaxID=34508 RepID=A0A4U5NGP1_STECR|nr:hypothetical protein L596_015721 [Steinernema carpocapsae]